MPKQHSQTRAVIGKRVAGAKILYQLQIGKNTQWLEYHDMLDHLDLIIEYEQQRKLPKHHNQHHSNHVQHIEVEDNGEGKEEQEIPRKEILEIIFIQERGQQNLFKVYFMDGSYRMMTNQQLRQTHPLALLDFYENNLDIRFD